jgi:iturin family lipopeptide synthetase B
MKTDNTTDIPELLALLRENNISINMKGENIELIDPGKNLNQELIYHIKSRKFEIVEFLNIYHRKAEYKPIPLAEKKKYYALSSMQKRLYFIWEIDRNSTNYNVTRLVFLKDQIQKEKLIAIFQKLFQRHEAFRTSFNYVKDTPHLFIENEVSPMIDFIDTDEDNAHRLINEFNRPFDLSEAPILHVEVLNVKNVGQILLTDMHHIISDGISQTILTKEFLNLYEGIHLEPLKVQYKDFSEWQKGRGYKKLIKEQEKYWLDLYSDEKTILQLPVDYKRPSFKSYKGDTVRFVISEKESNSIKDIGREHGGTLFITLLSIFHIILHKICNQEDIITGTPIAGRRHTDLENIIGMFVNTLALRSRPKGELTFLEYMAQVKDSTLKAYDNQDYQFEDLVEKVNVERDASRNPLFDVMFNLLNHRSTYKNSNGLADIYTDKFNKEVNIAKFDLLLTAIDCGEEIKFSLEYCTDLFKENTIKRLISYFKSVVTAIVSNNNIKISDIEIITDGEKNEILYEFNNTAAKYSKDKVIHELFKKQVEKSKDAIAVTYQNKHITYGELDDKSSKFGQYLRHRGITRNYPVGIMVNRSIDFIIGVLGIIKAGGAIVPIDPNYPQERIDYMVGNSDIKIIISQKGIKCNSDKIEVINIDDESNFNHYGNTVDNINTGNDLLYVIYTSGTTGTPKGVMIEHNNIVNLIEFQYSKTNINFNSSILQYASISFDVCYQEIFSTLLSGGHLFIVEEEGRIDMGQLFQFIDSNHIDVLFWPTALTKFVFRDEKFVELFPRTVKHIITAGEQLIIPKELKHLLIRRKIFLHNHYGPSETHVVTTLTINPDEEIPEIPTIGRPISNNRIYIFDRNLHLQPIGITGELYISGENVGRGYHNNEALTNERYILDPFYSDERMYKTGDIAKWNNDGTIEYLGRIDHQVKIRGFRIELNEIEHHLLTYKCIQEVVVIVREDTNKNINLIAYYTSTEDLNISDLKQYLSAKLPSYMIPAYFIQIDNIPLTSNKKVDRKALPEPEFKVGDNYIAPRNELEDMLVGIWSECLSIDRGRISVASNFFDIGGNSFRVIQVIANIEKLFNVKMPIVDFFKEPIIQNVSEYISSVQSIVKQKSIIKENQIEVTI